MGADRSDISAETRISPPATLLVCVTCKSDEGLLGAPLFDALAARLGGELDIALRPVECLSVCKRPCTVALAAPGKWTYVVGDLTVHGHVEDIVTAARPHFAGPHRPVPPGARPHTLPEGGTLRP